MWHTPVIPAIWETGAGGLPSSSSVSATKQGSKQFNETLTQKIKSAGDVVH